MEEDKSTKFEFEVTNIDNDAYNKMKRESFEDELDTDESDPREIHVTYRTDDTTDYSNIVVIGRSDGFTDMNDFKEEVKKQGISKIVDVVKREYPNTLSRLTPLISSVGLRQFYYMIPPSTIALYNDGELDLGEDPISEVIIKVLSEYAWFKTILDTLDQKDEDGSDITTSKLSWYIDNAAEGFGALYPIGVEADSPKYRTYGTYLLIMPLADEEAIMYDNGNIEDFSVGYYKFLRELYRTIMEVTPLPDDYDEQDELEDDEPDDKEDTGNDDTEYKEE